MNRRQVELAQSEGETNVWRFRCMLGHEFDVWGMEHQLHDELIFAPDDLGSTVCPSCETPGAPLGPLDRDEDL